MKNILLMIIFGLLITPVFANGLNDIDKEEMKCINSTSSAKEMMECTNRARQAWEKEMQMILFDLKDNVSTQQYKLIQKSQKSWEKAKDYQYEFIDVCSEKTQSITTQANFKKEIVKQRTKELKEYFNLNKQ